jgi:hypothetical protein
MGEIQTIVLHLYDFLTLGYRLLIQHGYIP